MSAVGLLISPIVSRNSRSPEDIATLHHWCRKGYGIASSGGRIDSWADWQGRGFSWTGSGGTRPIDGGGYGVFSEADSTKMQAALALATTASVTHFFVASLSFPDHSEGLYLYEASGGADLGYLYSDSTQSLYAQRPLGTQTATNGAQFVFDELMVAAFVTSPGALKIYINGELKTSRSSGNFAAAVANVQLGFIIGGYYLTGAIHDELLYTSDIGDTAVAEVSEMLMTLRGIP